MGLGRLLSAGWKPGSHWASRGSIFYSPFPHKSRSSKEKWTEDADSCTPHWSSSPQPPLPANAHPGSSDSSPRVPATHRGPQQIALPQIKNKQNHHPSNLHLKCNYKTQENAASYRPALHTRPSRLVSSFASPTPGRQRAASGWQPHPSPASPSQGLLLIPCLGWVTRIIGYK